MELDKQIAWCIIYGVMITVIIQIIWLGINYQEVDNKANSLCRKLGYDYGELASSVASANRIYCFKDGQIEGKEFLVNMEVK